uniref:Uncharacterized protein n=1 Tax=Spermophilus dauricus TaxID=99837 RepID=A0A8C9PTM5_SPEDA
MHMDVHQNGGRLPLCCLRTGNLRFGAPYSLARHQWSCGGPEINSLLQRSASPSCLAQQPEAQGQGRRTALGSEFSHSQESSVHRPR